MNKSTLIPIYICLRNCSMISKQCRNRSDAAECSIWSVSTLFAYGKYGIYSMAETQLSLTDSDSVKITEIWKENNRKWVPGLQNNPTAITCLHLNNRKSKYQETSTVWWHYEFLSSAIGQRLALVNQYWNAREQNQSEKQKLVLWNTCCRDWLGWKRWNYEQSYRA